MEFSTYAIILALKVSEFGAFWISDFLTGDIQSVLYSMPL
jgi:hypothetical protein